MVFRENRCMASWQLMTTPLALRAKPFLQPNKSYNKRWQKVPEGRNLYVYQWPAFLGSKFQKKGVGEEEEEPQNQFQLHINTLCQPLGKEREYGDAVPKVIPCCVWLLNILGVFLPKGPSSNFKHTPSHIHSANSLKGITHTPTFSILQSRTQLNVSCRYKSLLEY